MLIKFKEPDPRAGMTARMDSSRGQYFIDNGSADRVPENTEVAKAAPAPAQAPALSPSQDQKQEQEKPARDLAALATTFVEGTVPEVTGRIDGADNELLAAALAAENASEKPRKGVVDALTAAIDPQA
jgi:hypothetical protein